MFVRVKITYLNLQCEIFELLRKSFASTICCLLTLNEKKKFIKQLKYLENGIFHIRAISPEIISRSAAD